MQFPICHLIASSTKIGNSPDLGIIGTASLEISKAWFSSLNPLRDDRCLYLEGCCIIDPNSVKDHSDAPSKRHHGALPIAAACYRCHVERPDAS